MSHEGRDGPLLAQDPPVPADDYAPALWVPVARLLSARHSLRAMTEQLPRAVWEAPSACPGWSRRDLLAHLAAWEAQHHRALRAVLDGAPLHDWSPDADEPSLSRDAWNRREVERRRAQPLEAIVEELAVGLRETLRLLAALEPGQLLAAYGFAANLLAGLEQHNAHDAGHAGDIVNGPRMLR